MKTALIYTLSDSREADPIARVRYVGRTVMGLARRLKAHLYTARHGDHTGRSCWIRAVMAAGGSIDIEQVDSVQVEQCDQAEIAAIAKYRAAGCRLLNHTDGGGGLLNATPETRERIGASKRGNKFWVGKKHTPETRAKLSQAKKGKPRGWTMVLSPESRAKISASLRAKTYTTHALAREYGVQPRTINLIVHYKTWVAA